MKALLITGRMQDEVGKLKQVGIKTCSNWQKKTGEGNTIDDNDRERD